MKYYALISLTLLLTGCTYSISMVHTQGTAEDVIDTNQRADGDVSPTVDLPGAL
jgi:hypothetical protein